MVNKILTICFYLLFFLTPLLWFPWNFELFEYNKMMLVYLLTLTITTSWLIKMVKNKTLLLKRTPLDIPLMVFLLANIISTLFSIDTHTSFWGYYSRSNGGLLSLISYLLLYYALVSNFTSEFAFKFLKAALWGGGVVALYAIPEHFGVSPSCVLLTGQFNASCWVQDVQARVFATLGQPNWLAAYLGMLIFPVFYFLITSKNRFQLVTYYLLLIIYYLAFTFTYSRGATLGFLAAFSFFLVTVTYSWLHLGGGSTKLSNLRGWIKNKTLLFSLLTFFTINLLFGSALTDFKLLSKFAPPSRPSLTTAVEKSASGTQLENGGTESGAIRLIVWQGALEIFKHYPLFGSGVETFAYSYYQFRPTQHNLVSEWDFLYNKAHNEYLNYLATTGAGGFISYMAIILVFCYWAIKFSIHNFQISNNFQNSKIQNQKLQFPTSQIHTGFLTLTLLASYISYLVQNFFGFSVVVTALFFFLFPGLVFLATNSLQPLKLPQPIYTRLPSKLFILIISIAAAFFTITLVRYYLADNSFAAGVRAVESGNPGKAYNKLIEAVSLNPGEPYYKSELAFAAASSAVILGETDATVSAELKEKAVLETEQLLKNHPANVSYFRTAVRSYYILSALDKDFMEKTVQTIDQAIKLAPTDPKLTFNKALVLGQAGKKQDAIDILLKTVELRPNYREAYLTLGSFYFEEGDKEKAAQAIQKVLKIIPNDPEALERLKEWEK